MSGNQHVVPIMMDLDDCDIGDEFEVEEEETGEGGATGPLALLKSPLVLGGIGAVVLLSVAAAVLIGTGTVQMFGSPQLDNKSQLSGDQVVETEDGATLAEKDQPIEKGKTADDAAQYARSLPQAAPRKIVDTLPAAGYGQISYSGDSAIYHTSPTTISVQLGDARGELIVSLGILTDNESAELLWREGLTVNLILIESAQGVDYGPFREWEIPGLISQDVKGRIEAAIPDAAIRAIMIRDFELRS